MFINILSHNLRDCQHLIAEKTRTYNSYVTNRFRQSLSGIILILPALMRVALNVILLISDFVKIGCHS